MPLNPEEKIVLAMLESQLRTELKRLTSFTNLGDTAVYWMAHSTGEVVKEIQNQIRELKSRR